VKSVSEMMIDR